MSQQSNPLSYEGILELFRQTDQKFQETVAEMREMSRETDRKMVETDRKMAETDRMLKENAAQIKKTDRQISALGSRIGEIVENMVKGKIVQKFQKFGYKIIQYSRNKFFEYKKLGIRGEVDLFLENGDVAILIEVKTTLETADVRHHIERMEKYRRFSNASSGDKRRFIGAVAGAVVTDEAAEFAHQNGLFVIVQSGEAVEIIPPPDDFTAKEW